MRALLVAILLLTPFAAAAAPLKVVASFTVLADMVRQVGGGLVEVTALVGPDGDAHVFEPTPTDARAVAGADLLVVNGLGFEGWIDRLAKAAAYRGPVVVASAGVEPRRMSDNGREVIDPHAWQDLAQGRLYVTNIADGLARADAAHAAEYRANAERYRRQLDDLEDWVRAGIATVPAAKRQVITTHDAFGYFGRAYGVAFLAPEGLSTEAEVTAQALAGLIRQIRRTGIKAVFLENMADPRQIQQLAREAGAAIGGTLYVDALSPADGPAPTYAAMFRHNVPALVAAMGRN
jgi:zinc/manganese transport system substrate-binding protein